jgi:hypothetical protein
MKALRCFLRIADKANSPKTATRVVPVKSSAESAEPVFYLFPNLPQELRDEVWAQTLPALLRPTLRVYRSGCWLVRLMVEGEPGWDDTEDWGIQKQLSFRYDMLNSPQFDVPLLTVNHEARQIALAWICKNNLILRSCRNTGYPLIVRQFEPKRDVLYFPLEEWNRTHLDFNTRLFQGDLLDEVLTYSGKVRMFAVPETFPMSELAKVPEDLDAFVEAHVLMIVINPSPELQLIDSMKNYWEVDIANKGAFYWSRKHPIFEFRGGLNICDQALYKQIEDGCVALASKLLHELRHMETFEIRPVFAVRGQN